MNGNILIVDDSPILRKAIRKSVVMAGLPATAIFEAGNGQEALDLIAKSPFEVILLDLHMPVMDGEQFATVWSKRPELRHIMIVVVSTESNIERINRLKALGVHTFLPKPFEPEALAKLVKSHFGAAA